MTKRCTLKESFIERQLDKFQPGWRNGEDITAETKQKIREYVTSKLPKELKDDVSCITDFSIWHMAKKIREREELPKSKRSNKGKGRKVSECKPEEKEQSDPEAQPPSHVDEGVTEAVRSIVEEFGLHAVEEAITIIRNQEPPTAFSEEKK